MFLLVTLMICWFLLYWIFGGIFFACVALLKLKKIHKVRFSCLFSLFSAACAWGAAWYSVHWTEDKVDGCLAVQPILKKIPATILACGFWQFALSALAGLGILIIVGFGLLKLSSTKEKSWLTTFAERLEWNDKDEI
ncbi:MAG: hypothetical protein V1664_04100 [Candidatus Uhrbacteria bacterium]